MTIAIRRRKHVLELFERYSERVLRFARQSLPASEADDVVQDVFTNLMRMHDLEQRDVSVSYLYKIAENLIKRRRRQRARHQEALTTLQQRRRTRTAHDRRRLEGDGDSANVQEALDHLPDHEYQALLLIVAQGLAYDAVARTLGVPVSTVNNWKHRGLCKLKVQMRPDPQAN
ncbi:MAG: sigma-70 family RNA polymerase sigma factor [Phycisphaerales bacterium]|nr:sigma-70 family RNA polymerase sigma factor [Phycisphaerales bacterium]